jgi:hypothetical protein
MTPARRPSGLGDNASQYSRVSGLSRRNACSPSESGGVLAKDSPQPALHGSAEERMECHDPGLLDDEQRWRAFLQSLLHSMEEVEKDRDEMLLPERHQVGHLEDLQAPLAQTFGLSVEQMSKRAAQGVVDHGLPQALVLQGMHEVRHRAARALGQELESPPQGSPLRRRRGDALEVEQDLEPLLGPSTLVAPVNRRQAE